MTKLHITTIVITAAAIWSLIRWQVGYKVTVEEFGMLGIVSTCVYILYILLNKFFWKIPLLYPWFVNRPNIAGTWKVTVATNHNGNTEVTAYATFKQNLDSLHVCFYTAESTSFSISATIKNNSDGTHDLIYAYQNDPDVHLRGNGSDMHYGAVMAKLVGQKPVSFSGSYATYRLTRGNLYFSKLPGNIISSFSEGKQLDI